MGSHTEEHVVAHTTKIFPFFTVTSHQPHLTNNQWSCLEVQTKLLEIDLRLATLVMFWKIAVSQPGLMVPSTHTIPASSFVLDID